MNYARIALAALVGTVVYFAFGGVVFGALPWLRTEYAKFPVVYRTQEAMMPLFPIGIASMFVGIFVMSAIYAMAYQGGPGLTEGARFGALIGIFAVCGFVIHNYVNLNIGVKLSVLQGIAYFIEWTLVGIAIGLIYRRA